MKQLIFLCLILVSSFFEIQTKKMVKCPDMKTDENLPFDEFNKGLWFDVRSYVEPLPNKTYIASIACTAFNHSLTDDNPPRIKAMVVGQKSAYKKTFTGTIKSPGVILIDEYDETSDRSTEKFTINDKVS